MLVLVLVLVSLRGEIPSVRAPDQTEAVSRLFFLCQLHEENRQKEAKGGRVERAGSGEAAAQGMVCGGVAAAKKKRG